MQLRCRRMFAWRCWLNHYKLRRTKPHRKSKLTATKSPVQKSRTVLTWTAGKTHTTLIWRTRRSTLAPSMNGLNKASLRTSLFKGNWTQLKVSLNLRNYHRKKWLIPSRNLLRVEIMLHRRPLHLSKKLPRGAFVSFKSCAKSSKISWSRHELSVKWLVTIAIIGKASVMDFIGKSLIGINRQIHCLTSSSTKMVARMKILLTI